MISKQSIARGSVLLALMAIVTMAAPMWTAGQTALAGSGTVRDGAISRDIKGFGRDGSWRDGGWRALRSGPGAVAAAMPVSATVPVTAPELGADFAIGGLALLIGALAVARGGRGRPTPSG